MLTQWDGFLVEQATPAELATMLQKARPVPGLVRVLQSLIVANVPSHNLTADMVQNFMYSSSQFDVMLLTSLPPPGWHKTALSGRSVALCRIMHWLTSRFGGHEPTWVMFAELADSSLTVREIADLALTLEPLPG